MRKQKEGSILTRKQRCTILLIWNNDVKLQVMPDAGVNYQHLSRFWRRNKIPDLISNAFCLGLLMVCFCASVCNSVKASQYLVPDSVPVQRNDNHRRVWEEALVVERQISSLPSHIQHVSNPNRNINSMQSRKFDFCFLEIKICIFIHTDACTYNDHLLIKSKAPPGSLI